MKIHIVKKYTDEKNRNYKKGSIETVSNEYGKSLIIKGIAEEIKEFGETILFDSKGEKILKEV